VNKDFARLLDAIQGIFRDVRFELLRGFRVHVCELREVMFHQTFYVRAREIVLSWMRIGCEKVTFVAGTGGVVAFVSAELIASYNVFLFLKRSGKRKSVDEFVISFERIKRTQNMASKSTQFTVDVEDTRHVSMNIDSCKQLCEDAFLSSVTSSSSSMSAEKKKFSDFVSLIRGIVHYEHQTKRDALREGFDASSGLLPKRRKDAKSDAKSPTEHERVSVQFVTQFCQMMATAEYTLLSASEWDVAMEEDFMFRLPMTIDWAKGGYDVSLLKAFLKKNPELKVGLPTFSERVLLFKRGVTTSTHADLFIAEKIDLLLEYALKRPVGKVLRKAFGLGFGSSSSKGEESAFAAGGPGRSGGKRKVSKIERKTLRRLMPTIASVLKNVHKKLELSEPTFKEVILLYREDKIDAAEAQFLNVPSGAGPLRLKSFQNVPMADLEMVFPGVKICAKFIDYLTNGITMVLVLFSLIWAFITGEALSERAMQLLTVAGGKLSASWANIQKSKANYAAQMSKEVMKKMDSSGFAVLASVSTDMEEQETKEMILAYAAMRGNKSGMTIEELDDRLEQALMDAFGIAVDFDVHGSVKKLVEEGLASKIPGDSGMYQVVPIEKALKKLDKKWDALFEYSSSSKGGGAGSSEKSVLDANAEEDPSKMERDLLLQLANADTERGKEALKLTKKMDELNEKIADASGSLRKVNWRYS
jgi:hypothetical protein